jgi:hypothetical protein
MPQPHEIKITVTSALAEHPYHHDYDPQATAASVLSATLTAFGFASDGTTRYSLFHDGHEFTSDDVVFTYRQYLDPAFVSPWKGAFRVLESVTALGRYEVEFKLKTPFAAFPIQLVSPPIVPAGAGPELAEHPIGTSRNASGYRVMGYPGVAPNGYGHFSYRRKLSRERTKKGYLA